MSKQISRTIKQHVSQKATQMLITLVKSTINHSKNKAITDIKLRPCCAADRLHRLRPEIFRILLALAWHTE